MDSKRQKEACGSVAPERVVERRLEEPRLVVQEHPVSCRGSPGLIGSDRKQEETWWGR